MDLQTDSTSHVSLASTNLAAVSARGPRPSEVRASLLDSCTQLEDGLNCGVACIVQPVVLPGKGQSDQADLAREVPLLCCFS